MRGKAVFSAVTLALLVPATTYAQSAGGSAGAIPPMFANPYTNPYTNPFLNPYMTQYNTSPANAALYFFGAQAATGGIGSGRLSGVRPGPGGYSPGPQQLPDDGRALGVPASVSRYFHRGMGTGRYYNRQGRYYSQNRR